jgi:hypothetical protein
MAAGLEIAITAGEEADSTVSVGTAVATAKQHHATVSMV